MFYFIYAFSVFNDNNNTDANRILSFVQNIFHMESKARISARREREREKKSRLEERKSIIKHTFTLPLLGFHSTVLKPNLDRRDATNGRVFSVDLPSLVFHLTEVMQRFQYVSLGLNTD